MKKEEAIECAKKMTYQEAVRNTMYAKGVRYKKATRIKLHELAEIADKIDTTEPSDNTKDCTEFLLWLLEEIMDEENWEMNAVADGEIIARKLKKFGLLEVKDGYYVRTSLTYGLQNEELVQCKDCIHRQTYKCPMYHEEWYTIDEGDGYFDDNLVVCDYTVGDGYCHLGDTEDGMNEDYDYELATEQMEHYAMYEPTYNPEDGSM